MDAITSIHNPEIKAVAKLADAKGRKQQQRFIAEGLRTVATFIANNKQPISLFVTPRMQEQAEQLTTNFTLVSEQVMAKMSRAATPSGILGVFSIPPTPDSSLLGEGIVLAQLSDPGNIGTLIRTCAALARYSIVTVDSADVWAPKVVQSSAGTIALMNVFNWRWDELLEYKGTLTLVGLVATGGAQPNAQSLANSLLVVGNEAHGLSEHWVTTCDTLVTLPMPGGVESLNASVAGSIAMYLAWQPGS